jgi:hypothetical protein
VHVLFVDADASKEKEESAAHVADDARDLCARAWVHDAEFEVVEGDGGSAKRDATSGHGGGGADSTSTTTIWSSNGNPIATGSDLGSAVFFSFQKSIFGVDW